MRRPFARSERRGTPADLLVVGLGNPGQEFAGSLHNAGADAVTLLVQRHGASLRAEKGVTAAVAVLTLGGHRVALAVPTTYMNESGQAVRALATRFGIAEPSAIVIVHDELDLPPGTVRLKAGGGLAGHNGLRSVQSHLHSSDFLRVRIGVGKPPSAAQGASHVLRRPPKAVRETLVSAVSVAADAVEHIATDGIDAAMAWCHALPVPPA
ncbi:MAG TPA: aminoacyl-tRNA hydrolase [Acidimicrobiales bacterium]|nr:aminoacyl-tRNA hydrolase [Acidimicrobiales bacterium]